MKGGPLGQIIVNAGVVVAAEESFGAIKGVGKGVGSATGEAEGFVAE